MAKSLEISTPKTLSYGIKKIFFNCKNRMWFVFCYDAKLVAMTTSLEESEKLDLIKKTHANMFHLVKRS